MNKELSREVLVELEKIKNSLSEARIFFDEDLWRFVRVFIDENGQGIKQNINIGDIAAYSKSEELNQEKIIWMMQTFEDFALISERLEKTTKEIVEELESGNHIVITEDGEVELKKGATDFQKQIDKIANSLDPNLQTSASTLPITTMLEKSGVRDGSWLGTVKFFLGLATDLVASGVYNPITSNKDSEINRLSSKSGLDAKFQIQNLGIIDRFVENKEVSVFNVLTSDNKRYRAYNFEDFFFKSEKNGFIDLSGISKVEIDNRAYLVTGSNPPLLNANKVVIGVAFYNQKDSSQSKKIYFLSSSAEVLNQLITKTRSNTGTTIAKIVNGNSTILANLNVTTETPTVTVIPTRTGSSTNTITLTQTITPTSTKTKTANISNTDSYSLTESETLTAGISFTPSESETEDNTKTLTESVTSSYSSTESKTQNPKGVASKSQTTSLTETKTRDVSNTTSYSLTDSGTLTITNSTTPTESKTEYNTKTLTESTTSSYSLTETETEKLREIINKTKTTTNTITPEITREIQNITKSRVPVNFSSATITPSQSQTETNSATNTTIKTVNYDQKNKTLTTSITLTNSPSNNTGPNLPGLTITSSNSLTASTSDSLNNQIKNSSDTKSLTESLTESLTKTAEVVNATNSVTPVKNRIIEVSCNSNEKGDASFSCSSINGDYFAFDCQSKINDETSAAFDCQSQSGSLGIIKSLGVVFDKINQDIKIEKLEFDPNNSLNEQEKKDLLDNLQKEISKPVKAYFAGYKKGSDDISQKDNPTIKGLAAGLGTPLLIISLSAISLFAYKKFQKDGKGLAYRSTGYQYRTDEEVVIDISVNQTEQSGTTNPRNPLLKLSVKGVADQRAARTMFDVTTPIHEQVQRRRSTMFGSPYPRTSLLGKFDGVSSTPTRNPLLDIQVNGVSSTPTHPNPSIQAIVFEIETPEGKPNSTPRDELPSHSPSSITRLIPREGNDGQTP